MSLLVHTPCFPVIGNELQFNPFLSVQPKPTVEPSQENSLENNLQLNRSGKKVGGLNEK